MKVNPSLQLPEVFSDGPCFAHRIPRRILSCHESRQRRWWYFLKSSWPGKVFRVFVNWVKERFLSNRRGKEDIPQLRQLKPRKTPDAIVKAVCQEFNCQADQILRKGAKKNTARDVAIYLARELSGESGVDLGKYFGNICGAAVTVRYKHISDQISQNRRLKGRVNRVMNKIINNWDATPMF